MKNSPLGTVLLRRLLALLLTCIVLFLAASCSQAPLPPPMAEQPADEPSDEPKDEPADEPSDEGEGVFTVAAAGDISCVPGMDTTEFECRMSDTAALVEEVDPDAVLVLGDAQYEEATLHAFLESYDKTWGRFLDVTYPVPGNHEYKTADAAGYFAYFGERAGEPGRSWYAFNLGGWRLYALDSNCEVVGCGPGSPQFEWLREDLEKYSSHCVLAFWHHPRFSSSNHGDSVEMQDFWELLYESGAELVLAGHDHNYERFAPLDGAGEPAGDGIRQFVVGTGGRHLYETDSTHEASAVVYDDTFGILELELDSDGYRWRFLSTEGGSYDDQGEASCN